MRVLIDYRAALRGRSGVGEYAHQLTRALMQLDAPSGSRAPLLDLTLFSSSWKDRLAPGDELRDLPAVDRRVPVRLLNFAWHRLQWPAAETLTGRRFDVVHSFHPLLMPARHAAQVVTIYDLNFLHHPERTQAEIRRDYAALAGEHARRADRVIVISQFTAGEVTRLLGVPRDRLSICVPGAPPWAPRAHRSRDGYLLFFGTLEPRKNVGALLDAYEHLVARRRDVPPLLLAGGATEAAKPWLDRISHAPLAGRVTWRGYVSPDDRRVLYEGARMLVHPAFEEGFGLTVLEAMTLGVPVVCSDRGALPDVTGDAALRVNPDDVESIASAIERVLDDDPLADRLTTDGIERSKRFTWSAAAREALAAYEAARANFAARRGAA